jgi:hypothetical protein
MLGLENEYININHLYTKKELKNNIKKTNIVKLMIRNRTNNLRQIMKEVVQEVLKENGLITESSSKTDEIMMIKVGKHLFEGKISRVKKLK